jgi:hypothetical protein
MIMMNLKNTFNEDSFEYTTMNDIIAEGMKQPSESHYTKTFGTKMNYVFYLVQVIVERAFMQCR